MIARRPSHDAAARARLYQAVAWSAPPALVLGLLVGYARAAENGHGALAALTFGLVSAAGLGVLFVGVAVGFSELAGRVAGRLAHPKTPAHAFTHSRAAALVARGDLEAAVREYEAGIARHPGDGAPYLELARLHRDRLGRPLEALEWFRRAGDLATSTAGEQCLVVREMLEMARKHLENPLLVAPDLARHAERFQGTAEGRWAAEALAELKADYLG